VAIMQAVKTWRHEGIPVCYTIDAGPNVHVICPTGQAERITGQLHQLPGVIDILTAHPGEAARLI
jgi:diphosphomevalonate decarboxylase